MSDTTFAVSPDVPPTGPRDTVDHAGKLRTAPAAADRGDVAAAEPLVACDDTACPAPSGSRSTTTSRSACPWTRSGSPRPRVRPPSSTRTPSGSGTASSGYKGKEKLVVVRLDFLPGRDNPWPEVLKAFGGQLADCTGGLTSLVEADFSTTGPVEWAVSHLMAMDAFKSYFEYVLLAGCGIPTVTLTGTAEDWRRLREGPAVRRLRARELAEALDPVLAEFERAKAGRADAEFLAVDVPLPQRVRPGRPDGG